MPSPFFLPPRPSLAAPAAAPADAKAKAVPVEFKLKSPQAKTVQLSGAFLVRSGGRKDMVKGADGDWQLTLYLQPGAYRYNFLVNGKKSLDPLNSKIDRGASVIQVTPPPATAP
jgi:1,4-alpha-glucan branching enzyme